MSRLAAYASPEVNALGASSTTVIIPVGSFEQHGSHLPLDTDTVIAQAVSDRVADAWGPGALVAPAVAFGASGEHQAFAGTVSIGCDALRASVIEIVRSVRTWAEQVVFVNGHGGNVAALHEAVRQLRHEQHPVWWFPCAAPGMDLHAGHAETSMMLRIKPESVRMQFAERGNTAPLARILPTMMVDGVQAVSSNGVLGDPLGASSTVGEILLQQMVRGVLDQSSALGFDVEGRSCE